MSDINTTQVKKDLTNKPIAKKANNKNWWIGALVMVLVLVIGGVAFNTFAPKTSTSKADSVNQSCTIRGDNKTCINGVVADKDNKNPRPTRRDPRTPRTTNSRTVIQPKQPVVEKPEINPYTGEKQ